MRRSAGCSSLESAEELPKEAAAITTSTAIVTVSGEENDHQESGGSAEVRLRTKQTKSCQRFPSCAATATAAAAAAAAAAEQDRKTQPQDSPADMEQLKVIHKSSTFSNFGSASKFSNWLSSLTSENRSRSKVKNSKSLSEY